jgi:hypothetical protein
MLGLSVLFSIAFGSAEATAQGAETAPPPAGRAPAPTPAPAPSRQPTKPPADEARGYAVRPGTEPEDVGLFVPRLVLTVPRYALRILFFPLIATVRYVDRHALVEKVTDFLYNDERTAAILPVISLDTFFGPSFGVKAFHDDLGGHGERGRIDVRFGGRFEQAYQLHFNADRSAGTRLWLESLTRFEIEPGLLFQGIGDGDSRAAGSGLSPRDAAVETRFRERRLLMLLRSGYTIGKQGALTKLGGSAVFNSRKFDRAERGHGPSTEDVYDTRQLVGYEEGANLLELDANLIVDTRDVGGATSSGIYLEAFGGGVPALADYHFWHYGVEATSYFDLYAKTRVLVLRAAVEGVEGATENIPFSELPRLGGPHRLRGYTRDRFRDEKAALGTVEYHYPIHQFVAGSLYVDVGHVAPNYSQLFGRSGWKVGGGGGFIVRSRDNVLFTFDIAYGDGLAFHFTTDPLRAFSDREKEL